MRRDFTLENGIYCKGLYNDFKLYYNNTELTPSCNSIVYIPNTLIVLKSKKMVYVYIPITICIDGKDVLYEIGKFEIK